MLVLGRRMKLGKHRVGNVKSSSSSRRRNSGESGGRREGIGLRGTFRKGEQETNGHFEGRKDKVTDVEKEGGRGVEDSTGQDFGVESGAVLEQWRGNGFWWMLENHNLCVTCTVSA